MPPPSAESLAPAEARSGDVVLRATVMPTSRLNPAMAQQYGIQPDPSTVLLVMGLRRGPASQETSVQAQVRAQATDLLGKRHVVALREVRSDGFIDYVGTTSISLPDTLRFDISATPVNAPAITLRFNRDFFPASASP